MRSTSAGDDLYALHASDRAKSCSAPVGTCRLGHARPPGASTDSQAVTGLNEDGRRVPNAIQVLVVCTANLCRSPMAEFLLRDAANTRGLNWLISSAGTHADNGQSLHRYTERLLRSRGLQTQGWTTRCVDNFVLDGNDLILTAGRQHRSLILAARPDLLDRTFPLLQFAALAHAARDAGIWHPGVADCTAILAAVHSVRARTRVDSKDMDLSDPVGQLYHRFRRCGNKIDGVITQIFGD